MDLALANTQKKSTEELLLAQALPLCEEAASTDDQLYRCASGVFNGIANFYITGEQDLRVQDNDPYRICKTQPDRYKESCYGNMNSTAFWLSKNDFLKAAAYPKTIRDDAYAIPSLRYLAGMAAMIDLKKPALLAKSCRTLESRFHAPCIEGLAHGLLEHGTPNLEYADAFNFCRSPGLTQDEKDRCFRYVLSNITGWYSHAKSREICAGAEEKYRAYCRI
jgi:hypothetical protein